MLLSDLVYPVGKWQQRRLGARRTGGTEMKKLATLVVTVGFTLMIGITSWAEDVVQKAADDVEVVTDDAVDASAEAAGAATGAAADAAVVGTEAAADTAATGAAAAGAVPGAAAGSAVGAEEATRKAVDAGPAK